MSFILSAVWDQNNLSFDVKLREIATNFVSSKFRMRFLIWNAKNKLLFAQFRDSLDSDHLDIWYQTGGDFCEIRVCFFVFAFLFCRVWFGEMKWMIISLQFEIKTVCRLMSNCGEIGDHFVSSKFEWDFDFEMQRTTSCFPISSSVWTQIIQTFDIKLAKISANRSLFFVFVVCFVGFDFEIMECAFSFYTHRGTSKSVSHLSSITKRIQNYHAIISQRARGTKSTRIAWFKIKISLAPSCSQRWMWATLYQDVCNHV